MKLWDSSKQYYKHWAHNTDSSISLVWPSFNPLTTNNFFFSCQHIGANRVR